MKRIFLMIAVFVLTIAAGAQTLNVNVGNVTYKFPSAQTGDMMFSDGTTLTIINKEFPVDEIGGMTVDYTSVTDNTVVVSYNGSVATITVAGNVAQYLTITQEGAHVSIAQSDDLAQEITYTLTGTTSDGEFYMSGSYKATIELNGLTLTNVNPVYSGAAVHIQNGKRINVKVANGTTNTLVDAASGSQKGCLYVKGHAEFKQNGTLNIVGNVKHGIKAGEYISVKNATINVTSAVGDGISCNEYFLMESGTVNISGTDDDGIQCDLDGDTSTGMTTNHEDEDSGNIYIEGGTVTISGGQLTDITNGHGFYIDNNGSVTLGWTNPSDFIFANYCRIESGTISIAEGKAFITDDGTIIRTRAADVRLCGRSTQGVRIMRLAEGSTVVGVCRAEKEEEAPEEDEGAETAEAGITGTEPEADGTGNAPEQKDE